MEGGSLPLAEATAAAVRSRPAAPRVVVGRARPSSLLSSKAFSTVPLLSAAASAVPVRGVALVHLFCAHAREAGGPTHHPQRQGRCGAGTGRWPRLSARCARSSRLSSRRLAHSQRAFCHAVPRPRPVGLSEDALGRRGRNTRPPGAQCARVAREALETAAWCCLHPCASSAPSLCGRATVDPSDPRGAARNSVPAPLCPISAPPRRECDGTRRCSLPHPAPAPRLRAPAQSWFLPSTRDGTSSCDAFRDQKSECTGTPSMLRADGALTAPTPTAHPAAAKQPHTPHKTLGTTLKHTSHANATTQPLENNPEHCQDPRIFHNAASRAAHRRKQGNTRQPRSYAARNAATPNLHE